MMVDLTDEEIETMRLWIRQYYVKAGHPNSAGMADRLCHMAMRKNKVEITREIRTLIEDFDNPCFGSKIHNEIPHKIGLLIIKAVKEKKP